ncbi:MAG: hypothetical protein AAGG07_14500 [Planctomycetota bacterium]
MPWTRAARLGEHDGVLAELIADCKFRRDRTAARVLGCHLGRRLLRLPGFQSDAWFVPVATSRTHQIQRGIDHTRELARAAARAAGVRSAPLLKRRHGPSQLEVPPSRRAANVRGVFRVPARRARAGMPSLVILIDDVRTSGATLRAASRVLLEAALQRGARPELWVASVSVAIDPERRAGSPEAS